MKLRTIALALALSCGFSVVSEAANTRKSPASARVKSRNFKAAKRKPLKNRKMKVVKHKVKR